MDDAAADVPKRLFIPRFPLLLDGRVVKSRTAEIYREKSSSSFRNKPTATNRRLKLREIARIEIDWTKYPRRGFRAYRQLEFCPRAQLELDQSNIYPRLFTSVLIKLISASDGHVFMARY